MGKKDKHTDSDLVGLEALSSASDDGESRGLIGNLVRLPVMLVKTPLVVVSRLVRGIAHALAEIVKLPVRVVGGLVRPWKRKKGQSSDDG